MKKLLFSTLFVFICWIAQAQTQLWSITSSGGMHNAGTIFKMNLDGSGYFVAHSFDSATSFSPQGNLLFASNGKLYGMTENEGSIFNYDPLLNTFSTLITSTDSTGNYQSGSLIELSNGNLYGLTSAGGANNLGVSFSYNINTSSYNKLHNFLSASGSVPLGSLLKASNGKLYGTTSQGGTYNKGVIFSMDTTGVFSNLYSFGGNTFNSIYPLGNLIEATNGLLYGMAFTGGLYDDGVIFSFNPASNTYIDVFDFDYANGRNATGSLIEAADGKLYGMTENGGTNNIGVLFRYDISTNVYKKLIDFDYTNGATPQGSLFQASNGKLYGMTSGGGLDSAGVIFNYTITDSTFTKLRDLSPAIHDGTLPIYSAFIEIPATPNSIADLFTQSAITIFPNPANTIINITVPTTNNNQPTIIVVTDVLGREILKSNIKYPTSNINIEQWNNGVYFYQLINGSATLQGKWVVAH